MCFCSWAVQEKCVYKCQREGESESQSEREGVRERGKERKKGQAQEYCLDLSEGADMLRSS